MVRKEILERRVSEFQRLMRQKDVDTSMIRTLSSFTYFSGMKWLRPALLIPSDGDPIAFIFKYEAKEFVEKGWIGEVRMYSRAEELMKEVSATIRTAGYKKVGFDYSVERDSYVLFFELFRRLNPQIEIVNVHPLIMQLRMIKDESEVEAIRNASRIAEIGMKKAIEAVEVGKTELEVAAEAICEMMKRGSESPHIYVTTGPKPRVHAEPRSWVKINPNDTVQIVVAADYDGYYSNLTRTVFLGELSSERRKAFETSIEIHDEAEKNLKEGVRLIDIEISLRDILRERGYGNYYVTGFTHGVGLLIEEDPITTIVVPHRQYRVKQNMVLASVHAPLTLPDIGTIKFEDTYVVRAERAERLTKFDYEITK